MRFRIPLYCRTFVFALSVMLCFAAPTFAQTAKTPAITQIDADGLKKLLKTNGKPLLINFWATWCDPCREEFPELVKINNEYKGKIDFITVSLDDVDDIGVAVPKFLMEMKAEMPAYLLATPDEGAAITSVSEKWAGGLPFTVLFSEKGTIFYFRQGKVIPALLRSELQKSLAASNSEK